MAYVWGMAAERSKICIRGFIFLMQYYYISHGLRLGNGRGAVKALYSRVYFPDAVLLYIAWLTFGEWPRSGHRFVTAGKTRGCCALICNYVLEEGDS